MTENMKNARDLVIVIVTLVVTKVILSILDVPFSGPIAVLVSLAVATWCLKRQGLDWSALGLARPRSPLRLVGMVFGAAIVALLAGNATVALATKILGWPAISNAVYGDLHGNLPRLAMFLVIAWTSAGFGEEMLFRGFFLTRLEGLLGKTRLALMLAVVLQAILFGLSHYKQGATGIVVTGVIGLVFGIFYARGRNLWPLIIAHGLMDALSLIGLYAGVK